MMFKVLIAESVKKFIIDNIKSNINLTSKVDIVISKATVTGMYETIQNIFINLSDNPYCYPQIDNETRMVVEPYLSFIFFYIIKEDTIFITDCKPRLDIVS